MNELLADGAKLHDYEAFIAVVEAGNLTRAAKRLRRSLQSVTLADAICDRLVHNAHVLSVKGPSIRKTRGLAGKSTEERGAVAR
jgi:hypothetical protein